MQKQMFVITSNTIVFGFIALLTLVPLFYTTLNYELFEYNKMLLTYAVTVIIVGAWVIKMIVSERIIFSRSFLDRAILFFLVANVLATIFSIDPHTSIFGYYSRSNGGLLSILSYSLLYWALVSNLDRLTVWRLLQVSLASAFLVAAWGVLQHFGIDAHYWVQDVKARVFSTLGQPNWLAAYLAMLLPVAFAFFLRQTAKLRQLFFLVLCATLYACFIFTYSRGGAFGLSGAFFVFAGSLVWIKYPQLIHRLVIVIVTAGLLIMLTFLFVKTNPLFIYAPLASLLLLCVALARFLSAARQPVASLAIVVTILTLLFANPASYRLAEQKSPTQGGVESQNSSSFAAPKETGNIRLIVWQGAFDIFKHYPLFGSGVETFAYSYYQFRPPAHNLTTEWDFLYNKAHNEYLNYLATTGIVGFSAYILLICAYLFYAMRKMSTEVIESTSHLIPAALLAGYVSYLLQNTVSFSVVPISLLFFLFPAMSFILSQEDVKNESSEPSQFVSLPWHKRVQRLWGLTTLFRADWKTNQIVARRTAQTDLLTSLTRLQQGFISLTMATALLLLAVLARMWLADMHFTVGYNASHQGDLVESLDELSTATSLNPLEPFYHSELSYVAAALAPEAKKDSELGATASAQLEQLALSEASRALTISPFSLNYWKNLINVYLSLAELDPRYLEKAKKAYEQTIRLAPTDAKTRYNYARFLWTLGEKEKAIAELTTTVELKEDYRDARLSLADHLHETGKDNRALIQLHAILERIDPNDGLAQEKLASWSALSKPVVSVVEPVEGSALSKIKGSASIGSGSAKKQ